MDYDNKVERGCAGESDETTGGMSTIAWERDRGACSDETHGADDSKQAEEGRKREAEETSEGT